MSFKNELQKLDEELLIKVFEFALYSINSGKTEPYKLARYNMGIGIPEAYAISHVFHQLAISKQTDITTIKELNDHKNAIANSHK